MTQVMSAQELRRRAIARALANGGAKAVSRVRYGLYQVASATRPGQRHTVSQSGAPGAAGHLHCTCEAGLAGRPCWHAAAVFVAKTEAGGGRVTGPSVTPAPSAALAPAAPAPAEELPGNVTVLRGRAA